LECVTELINRSRNNLTEEKLHFSSESGTIAQSQFYVYLLLQYLFAFRYYRWVSMYDNSWTDVENSENPFDNTHSCALVHTMLAGYIFTRTCIPHTLSFSSPSLFFRFLFRLHIRMYSRRAACVLNQYHLVRQKKKTVVLYEEQFKEQSNIFFPSL